MLGTVSYAAEASPTVKCAAYNELHHEFLPNGHLASERNHFALGNIIRRHETELDLDYFGLDGSLQVAPRKE
jgi:hypothetical protein